MSNDDLIRRGDALRAVQGNGAAKWTDIRDAIRALPARGVGVKRLVWEPWNLGVSQARSPFGIYHTWNGYWRRPEGGRGIEADDPEAAAQADYESRIRAALEPTLALIGDR